MTENEELHSRMDRIEDKTAIALKELTTSINRLTVAVTESVTKREADVARMNEHSIELKKLDERQDFTEKEVVVLKEKVRGLVDGKSKNVEMYYKIVGTVLTFVILGGLFSYLTL